MRRFVDLPMLVGVVIALTAGSLSGEGLSLSGAVRFESRWFYEEPLYPGQPTAGVSLSASLSPELRYASPGGRDRFTLVPFVRWDADDRERSHWDLREATWLHTADRWDLQAGVGRVFWGVTESRHLVDIINQTDFVEDIDEEDKLGQPMVNLNLNRGWGTLRLYLLPGFRERTFPASDARLSVFPLDIGDAAFESDAGTGRLDLAARAEGYAGGWDLGLSVFHGTSREPRFVVTSSPNGVASLQPTYDIIQQIGFDGQWTTGPWLLKLEAMARRGHDTPFAAGVTGFEYTEFGIGSSAADLGFLFEVLYDGRSRSAPPTIYDNDLFFGTRLALNDPADTTFLVGAIFDRGGNGTLGILEATRRLSGGLTLEIEARLLGGEESADPYLATVRQDSHLVLRVSKFL